MARPALPHASAPRGSTVHCRVRGSRRLQAGRPCHSWALGRSSGACGQPQAVEFLGASCHLPRPGEIKAGPRAVEPKSTRPQLDGPTGTLKARRRPGQSGAEAQGPRGLLSLLLTVAPAQPPVTRCQAHGPPVPAPEPGAVQQGLRVCVQCPSAPGWVGPAQRCLEAGRHDSSSRVGSGQGSLV